MSTISLNFPEITDGCGALLLYAVKKNLKKEKRYVFVVMARARADPTGRRFSFSRTNTSYSYSAPIFSQMFPPEIGILIEVSGIPHEVFRLEFRLYLMSRDRKMEKKCEISQALRMTRIFTRCSVIKISISSEIQNFETFKFGDFHNILLFRGTPAIFECYELGINGNIINCNPRTIDVL